MIRAAVSNFARKMLLEFGFSATMNWRSGFGGAVFSLRVLYLAGTKPRKLKPAPPNHWRIIRAH